MSKLDNIINESRLPAAGFVIAVDISCIVHFKCNDNRIGILDIFLVFSRFMSLVAVIVRSYALGNYTFLFKSVKSKIHRQLDVVIREEIRYLAVFAKL